MSQYKLVRFNLNGKDVEKMVDVRASLTDMLRNDYHMTSVKKGCEVGECGACNVIIDGEAFNSCIYLAVWADGKHIRTLESLMGEDGELSDIQQAFLEEAAVQCGFCTPGFIMTAVEILESGKLYSDDELRQFLVESPNVLFQLSAFTGISQKQLIQFIGVLSHISGSQPARYTFANIEIFFSITFFYFRVAIVRK